MHSVGALKISEIAKLLEMAGKNEDIDYILEHHNQLMVEFKYLFTEEEFNEAFSLVDEKFIEMT